MLPYKFLHWKEACFNNIIIKLNVYQWKGASGVVEGSSNKQTRSQISVNVIIYSC